MNKKEITREEFIEFFRSDDYYKLTPNDRKELFLDSLKGSSDITYDLLEELCDNYSVSLKEIIN